MSRKLGIMPPAKIIVMSTITISTLPPRRRDFESGYAVIAVSSVPNTVPTIVTMIEVAKPVYTCGLLKTERYVSRLKPFGYRNTPPLSVSSIELNDCMTTCQNGYSMTRQRTVMNV